MTGKVRLVPTPCGATLASKCAPCAHKNRVLRMQQCREGWHLDEEPEREETSPDPDDESDDRMTRRIRSLPSAGAVRPDDARTRPTCPASRWSSERSAPLSPRLPGKTYRPSMFVTFTLPSYGPVRTDGTPVDPSTYDYRRAALDALHFPKLVDRVWQNLRRATGYQVQYFAVGGGAAPPGSPSACGDPGRDPPRAAARGRRATYHQVWWPAHEKPVFTGRSSPSGWTSVGYVDPTTRRPLPTWDGPSTRWTRIRTRSPPTSFGFGKPARHPGHHRGRG